jgi:hypothetical protein
MATTRAPKRAVRLVVRITENNSFGDHYLHLTTEVVYYDNDDQRWLNTFNCSYRASELAGLYGLGVHAQADRSAARFYGYRLSYADLHRVELDEMEVMIKTFRRIERKMSQQRAALGWESSVSDMVARFAQAVGCTGKQVFGFHGLDWATIQDNQGYSWFSADSMKYQIDQGLQKWAAKYGIPAQED